MQIPDDSSKPQYLALRVVGRHNILQGRIDDSRAFLNRWQRQAGEGKDPEEISRPSVPRDLRESLLFQLLDARRDVVEELRTRSSFWGRLVGELDLDEELAEGVFEELAAIGKRIVSGSKVLSDVQSQIQRSVDTLAPAAGSVGLKPLPTITDSLARSMDVVVSAPASPEISLGRQGMGARSLAVLMIFQAFAERRLSERSGVPTLSVTAFEEPEVHLHPHASRVVLPLVKSVPGQRVISTHSTNVAGAAELGDVRVMRRMGPRITSHRLSDRASKEIKNRPVEKLVVRSQSDVLFARAVILVEGESEERMLHPFFAAEFGGKSPEGVGVTIVDTGGAQGLTPFALLVESFGGPWVSLLDGDTEAARAVEAAAKALNRQLDKNATEIVMLPDGCTMEQYALKLPFRATLLAALASQFGSEALEGYRELHDGKPGPKKTVRNYRSEGWEERLLHDFLRDHKPVWAEAFGRACCDQNPVLLPERIKTLLARVKTYLEVGNDEAQSYS